MSATSDLKIILLFHSCISIKSISNIVNRSVRCWQHSSLLPESVFSSRVQFKQLGEPHPAERPRAVGGAVHRLVVHQYRDAVSRELQVQLNSCGPVLTGLERDTQTRESRIYKEVIV